MKKRTVLPIIVAALLFSACEKKQDCEVTNTFTLEITNTTPDDIYIAVFTNGQDAMNTHFYVKPYQTSSLPEKAGWIKVFSFGENSLSEKNTEFNANACDKKTIVL